MSVYSATWRQTPRSKGIFHGAQAFRALMYLHCVMEQSAERRSSSSFLYAGESLNFVRLGSHLRFSSFLYHRRKTKLKITVGPHWFSVMVSVIWPRPALSCRTSFPHLNGLRAQITALLFLTYLGVSHHITLDRLCTKILPYRADEK